MSIESYHNGGSVRNRASVDNEYFRESVNHAIYYFNVFSGNLGYVLKRSNIKYSTFWRSLRTTGIKIGRRPFVNVVNQGVCLPPNTVYLTILSNWLGIGLDKMLLDAESFRLYFDGVYNTGKWWYRGAIVDTFGSGGGAVWHVKQSGLYTLNRFRVNGRVLYSMSLEQFEEYFFKSFPIIRGTVQYSHVADNGDVVVLCGYDALQMKERGIKEGVLNRLCCCIVSHGGRYAFDSSSSSVVPSSSNVGSVVIRSLVPDGLAFGYSVCSVCGGYCLEDLEIVKLKRELGMLGDVSLLPVVTAVRYKRLGKHIVEGVGEIFGADGAEAGEVVGKSGKKRLGGLMSGIRSNVEAISQPQSVTGVELVKMPKRKG